MLTLLPAQARRTGIAVLAAVILAVTLVACAARGHQTAHGTSPSTSAHVQFQALDHHQANAVVLLARTRCRRVSRVSDHAAGRNEIVSVTISGPTNCTRYHHVTRVVARLRHGLNVWCYGGKLIDAATRRPVPDAKHAQRPVFSCPAHAKA